MLIRCLAKVHYPDLPVTTNAVERKQSLEQSASAPHVILPPRVRPSCVIAAKQKTSTIIRHRTARRWTTEDATKSSVMAYIVDFSPVGVRTVPFPAKAWVYEFFTSSREVTLRSITQRKRRSLEMHTKNTSRGQPRRNFLLTKLFAVVLFVPDGATLVPPALRIVLRCFHAVFNAKRKLTETTRQLRRSATPS